MASNCENYTKKIPLDRTADVEQASSEVIVARSPLPAEKGMGRALPDRDS